MNTKLLPLMAILMLVLLSACAGKQAFNDECAIQLRAASEQLNVAEAKGLTGLESYIKASELLNASKAMQDDDDFDSCIENAKDARSNIAQALLGG